MTIEQVWVEKYRPQSMADIIMTNDSHRRIFDGYVKKGAIPNLLLYGGPGTGKSSTSKALTRDLGILRNDIKTIKCSDEKIDAIRDKVKGFAMTMPLGKFKVVRLEEFDNIGLDAQKLLRSLIEDVSDSCRFIATCNYVNRLLPEMRSRFQEFGFSSPSVEDVAMRAADILESENIKFDPEVLMDVIAIAHPDFRKVIQILEQSSTTGELILDKDNDKIDNWKLDLLPLIEAGNWQAARKLVCGSSTKEELPEIFRFLYQNIARCKKTPLLADQATVLIAQYQYQHSFVADPEIQLAALFIELSNLK